MRRGMILNFFTAALIVLCQLSCSPGGQPEPSAPVIVNAAHVVDIGSLKPAVSESDFFHFTNIFAVDNDKRLFFLDKKQHRILVFTPGGEFIKQIGSIGQEKEDLFNPCGIFIYDNRLYILDNFGEEQRIKEFSSTGDYLSTIHLNNSKFSRSFFIANDTLFINETGKNSGDSSLISAYSLNGEKQQGLGIKNNVNGAAANETFNSVYLSCNGNRIYGAFKFVPTYFRLGLNRTGEPFYKDLRFAEIKKIAREGKERGADTLETILAQKQARKRIATMNYCFGFAVDDQDNVLYSVNYHRASKGVILHMDTDGNLKKRIVLKLADKWVMAFSLYFSQKNWFSIVLGEKERFHLIKFTISKKSDNSHNALMPGQTGK